MLLLKRLEMFIVHSEVSSCNNPECSQKNGNCTVKGLPCIDAKSKVEFTTSIKHWILESWEATCSKPMQEPIVNENAVYWDENNKT